MKTFSKIDQAIYRGERILAGWISLGMALIVFLDVVHRIFSRTPGRISSLLGGFLNRDPMVLDSLISPSIISLSLWAVTYAALRTRGERKVFVKSVVAMLALTAIVQAFLYFVPEGLVWSPYLGLSALLWMGLLGASMATHNGQHLSMELGEKLWPKKYLGTVRKFNGVIVALFCLMLSVLAAASLVDHFHDWKSGPGAGLIPSIDWPKWAVFLVLPYSFFMMALRFFAQAFGWVKRPETSL